MKANKTFLLLLFMMCISCNIAVKKTSAGQDVLENEFPKVFKSKVLQDTLVKFINAVDSFPNPYGPPIYSIIYDTHNSDSIISLYAYGLIVGDLTIPGETPLVPAGALEHKGKIIVALYDPNLSGSVYSVIDSAQFSMDIYKRHLHYEGPYYEWDVSPSVRHYQFSYPDSLQVLYIRKSKYEDPSAHGIMGLVTFDDRKK